MGNKYFNIYEFNKALDNHYDNPYLAKEMYKDYFDKYPKDYTSYPYYISLLISIGELENAEKLFNYIENKVNFDNHFIQDKIKYHYFQYGMFSLKIKLLFQMERYEELLDYTVLSDNETMYENVKRLIQETNKDNYHVLIDDHTPNCLAFQAQLEEFGLNGCSIKMLNEINGKNGVWKGNTLSNDMDPKDMLHEFEEMISCQNRVQPQEYDHDEMEQGEEYEEYDHDGIEL